MKWILIINFCFMSSGFAKEVRVDFADLRKLVEMQNERIQASHLEVEASRSRQGHFRRSFLPKIEAHAAQENFKTGTQHDKSQPDFGAEARVNLYNGGRDYIREEGLRTHSERRGFETKTLLAEELGKARELYWSIVFEKSRLSLIKELLQMNENNLRAALRRIKSGVATDSDRLEFEMRRLDLVREQGEAELASHSRSRELLIILGFEAQDMLVTEAELAHAAEWEGEIKHTHDDHNFLVMPSTLLAKETEFAAKEARRFWLPTVDVYAGWNQYNEREEDADRARERQESVIGIQMKFNLLDGFSARREAAALRSQAAAAQKLASYAHKQNEVHVENEFEELRFLHDRVHEAEGNIQSASKYYRMTHSEYSRGVKNSPDVLGASEKLYAMKLKRLEMIRDFQIARSHVLSKIGK